MEASEKVLTHDSGKSVVDARKEVYKFPFGTLGISTLAVLVVLGIWNIVTSLHIYPPLFLPSPLSVAKQFYVLSVGNYGGLNLFQNTGISLARVMSGFVLAVITGVPIGVLMGRSQVIEAVLNPFMQLYRPVPPLAFIPLLIVWLGIGEAPKVVLIYIGTVPIIILDTLAGVKGVREVAIRVAASLGANRWQIMRYVLLPSALPSIFTGMRVGVGIAWTCLVAAEMIASTSGLGWMILNASRYLSTDVIFVGILTIGIIGVISDGILRALERWLIPWQGKW